jgi:hypothetical protein
VVVATYGSGPAVELADRYLRGRMDAGALGLRAAAVFWTEYDGSVTVGERRAWYDPAGKVVDAVIDLVDEGGRGVVSEDAARFLMGPEAGLSAATVDDIRRTIRPATTAIVVVLDAGSGAAGDQAFDVTRPRRRVEGPLPALPPER